MFGYIYVIRLLDNPHLFTDHNIKGCSYKIGRSKDVDNRNRLLRVLMPHPSELIVAIPTSDMQWGERYLHGKLADLRMHGEWFRLTRQHFNWLMNLHSPYAPELTEENRWQLDRDFTFYIY